jgi:tripartite-type tricarboxylate transporter receptor subunit TctC
MSAGRILSAAVVALGVFGSFLPAHAEPYPTRPIKVIVPTPAGGPVDVVARLVGNYLAAAFGQAVVVDNRPGAGNTIGSKEAARRSPTATRCSTRASAGWCSPHAPEECRLRSTHQL